MSKGDDAQITAVKPVKLARLCPCSCQARQAVGYFLQSVPVREKRRVFLRRAYGINGLIAALGTPAGSNNTHAYLMVPVELVPDYNRDGSIDNNDRGKISTNNPLRWWINDSGENGDIASGGNDIPASAGFQGIFTQNNYQSTVQGREDLINYFPLYFDISKLTQLLPPGSTYTYKLSQADSAVQFVYTSLVPSQVGGFLTNASVVLQYTNAAKINVTASGVALSNSWVSSIGDTNTAGGVLLLDGAAQTTNPLVLSVFNGSQQVASLQVPLSISSITNMYRTINLINPSQNNTSSPTNYPDTLCNNKMVVFVHGFNVDQPGASAWFAEAFKRLYRSGANSKFTGVIWNGNTAPDYWQAVANAFGTSQALINSVNSLPGGTNKIVIAHSLGNMLVSSALGDYGTNGLKISQYYMLDAAIPMEAFDTSTFPNTNMENATYYGYTNKLWASYWYQLFPSDGRSGLTWQNRLTNALAISPVNFYSSGEEVLANGNPTNVTTGVISAVTTALGFTSYTPYVWYLQEYFKGTSLQSALGDTAQGGWGVNPSTNYTVYTQNPYPALPSEAPIPASQANLITNSQLMTNPFFTPFTDVNLTTSSGGTEAARYTVRNPTLAKAIPALTYAVGCNNVNIFGPLNTKNIDMTGLEDGWPSITARPLDTNGVPSWYHSDIKDVAYPFTHNIWENIVNTGSLK